MPNLQNPTEDAKGLSKAARKRKITLSVQDPQTKKTIRQFRILKKEQAQKNEAERVEAPLTIDVGANQDIVGYFKRLEEELGKLGFMLVPTEGMVSSLEKR